MFFSPQRLPISWAGICVALVGALFCGLQVAPNGDSLPCPSTGCDLFQDFAIYGVSLWWVGVAYFIFMVLLCLRRARTFALTVATMALAADAVLLGIMLLTAPCVACLGAAAFIGVLFFVLRQHMANKSTAPSKPSVLFMLWFGLFVAVAANIGTELLPSWQLHGPQNAERRIYFSPSCPACRDAVIVFADSAAFFPVAERDSDYAAIYRMREALNSGKTLVEALAVADSEGATEPASMETLWFRLLLLRNKATVLRLGFDKLPLIFINGMPRSLRPGSEISAPQPETSRSVYGASADLPPELTAIDSCGETPEPCEAPR